MTDAKLPAPPKEVPRDNSLAGLAPRFRAALNRAVAAHRAAGHDPLIYETTRTNARQRWLYGFGRDYDDGRGQVTNSKNVDHTWHGFGLAVDVISASQGWNPPDAFWHDLRVAVEEEGLAWGGDWIHMRDLPHIQWGAPMRRSPSVRAAQLRDSGGLETVWKEVGAA